MKHGTMTVFIQPSPTILVFSSVKYEEVHIYVCQFEKIGCTGIIEKRLCPKSDLLKIRLSVFYQG